MKEEQTDGVELSNSFGKMKASGPITIVIILLLAICYVGFLLLHDHDLKSTHHLEKILDAQEATNYILTLSQEDRNKLSLGKPRAIREMEWNSRRDKQ